VARMARRFPSILPAIADGRLHMGAVVLLAPHLTEHTAVDLLAAAQHRTKAAIELLLAERFPRPDLPTLVQAIVLPVPNCEACPPPTAAPVPQLAPGPVVPSVAPFEPMHPVPLTPRPRIAPRSPGRFALQVTVDHETHEQLRYAQALLRHALPSGDVAEVLKRALDSLVRELEQQKFAKCARSRLGSSEANGRYVPAEIRRTVSQRDGGQCTFVSDGGKRCEANTWLEFDHVKAVARGGETTVQNLRLRCRAHNQYEAERMYGVGFMERKRDEARSRTTQAQEQAAERAAATEATATASATEHALGHIDAYARRDEVIPWLRQLGLRVDEAKRGAAMCDGMPDASLEDRVRFALSGLARERFRRTAPMVSAIG
ncbi:MAG: hypothetical protein ABIU54_12235, partial [Candidatus Eisenbacteria bacterium]